MFILHFLGYLSLQPKIREKYLAGSPRLRWRVTFAMLALEKGSGLEENWRGCSQEGEEGRTQRTSRFKGCLIRAALTRKIFTFLLSCSPKAENNKRWQIKRTVWQMSFHLKSIRIAFSLAFGNQHNDKEALKRKITQRGKKKNSTVVSRSLYQGPISHFKFLVNF